MDPSFSYSFRVAACDRCGAPHQAAIAAGGFACHFCNAQNMLAVRSEVVVALGRAPLGEAERIARLRAQDGKPLLPPPNLLHLMPSGQLAEWKVEEAVSIWNGARQTLRTNPSDFDAAERLLFLSMVIAQHFKSKGDKLRQRSLLEGALDVATLPRHRQVLRGFLTRAAVLAEDLEAAEAWLAPCDPSSDDLSMDSEWRFSRAFIDTAKGNFQNVLVVLGRGANDVPIEDAADDVCTVLRANAFERLGQVDVATALLRERFSTGGDSRQTIQRVIESYPQWQLCAQSHPQASAVFATTAGAEAASRSSGGLHYVFIPLGVLLILGGLALLAAGITAFFADDPLFHDDRWGYLGRGVAVALLGLLFAVIGFATKASADKTKWLHLNGLRAAGQITGAAPTGTRIGNIPVIRYTLVVSLPGRAPYEASTSHVGRSALGVLSGTVALRVHPENPHELVIEGDG
ncbi:MAG: hypothetical protein KF819_32700 [Labilithrix sp.]|nr:hypothetical protein [Labilithrix sp.]